MGSVFEHINNFEDEQGERERILTWLVFFIITGSAVIWVIWSNAI